MPFRGEAISEKTGLLNIPEYFAALQALFDTVKEAARAEQQAIAQERLESNLKVYLQNKDWARLAGFFMPYGRYFLDTIKKLRSEYGDGRLVKSIEDIILAGLLKNHVEYDFVVGNPPYVRVHRLTEEQKEYYTNYYQSAVGRFDLYVLFIERGIKWLKAEGKLSFITSNKFTSSGYGLGIRKVVVENCQIEHIIDFGDTGVFQDATNYPLIFVMNKSIKTQNLFTFVEALLSKEEILDYIKSHISGDFSDQYISIFKVNQDSLTEKSWKFIPTDKFDLFSKIKNSAGYILKDVAEIKLGLFTALDEAFIVNEKTAQKESLEKELLKPLLRGKDVRKWKISWNNEYIIYPYQSDSGTVDIDAYPKIKVHLLGFKDKLNNRSFVIKKSSKQWFEYANSGNPFGFIKPKIVVPDISTNNNFSIDQDGFFCLKTCYTIQPKNTLDIHFLLGVLNSNLLEFYFKRVSPFISGGYYRYMSSYLEQLPIRLPKTPEDQALAQQITACVEQILAKVKSDQRAARFPDEYIKEYRARGEEFDAVEIVFNANHKELAFGIEKAPDKEFLVKIKGAAPIVVDSEAKAEHVIASLTGKKVSKGEKIQILIPRSDALAREALAQWQKNLIEAQGIEALENEINELVYKLYGLDENDKKVIEEFLSKF